MVIEITLAVSPLSVSIFSHLRPGRKGNSTHPSHQNRSLSSPSCLLNGSVWRFRFASFEAGFG